MSFFFVFFRCRILCCLFGVDLRFLQVIYPHVFDVDLGELNRFVLSNASTCVRSSIVNETEIFEVGCFFFFNLSVCLCIVLPLSFPLCLAGMGANVQLD